MANTNITMKTEVVKLPDFYGQPEKDTISASEFMARMDECQVTNEWNDITTFSYFRLALRDQADKWLSSIVCHLQLKAGQKTWTHIRPVFKQNLLLFWMTNSSLMVWQNWHTDLMKTHGCFSRRLLFHKDHTRLMVEEAYKVFFTDHRLKMDKKATSVHAVTEEQEAVTPDQDIEAFRLQQGFSRPNINNCQNSNQPRLNASQNQNGKFCVYCKILNHSQEECRKCIQDNKPCVTNKGQLYWPKVNSTNDNPNAMQNNSNPNNGVSSVYL